MWWLMVHCVERKQKKHYSFNNKNIYLQIIGLQILYTKKQDNNNNKVKVKLATAVDGDPKAPFSIATTTRCWGGRFSFP